MSLRVWLPLNGDLRNQGLDGNVSVTNYGAVVNNSGKTGACYSFGTAKSYFKFDDVSFMHSFTECSITLWLKIISWNTSYATYFQFGLGSTAWSNYIFSLLRNNATSKLCFSIAKGSSSSQTSCSTPELQLNTWYHFSFIYASGHCKIYIDGVETTDLSTNIVPNFAGITTGTIGACNNGSSYQTNCLLNDFRIYDHALSEKEVKEIAKGLMLHYKLNEPYGLTDIITNQNGYVVYNNYASHGTTGTLTNLSEVYHGTVVRREKMVPAETDVNNFRTALGNHGVYGHSQTFLANTKYVFWIYYRPISHQNIRAGGTASNIGGWTEIPPVAVGDGWYRVGQYRNGTVTTDKRDNIFTSFYVPTVIANEEIIIDWASPHLLAGTTEIPNNEFFINDNIVSDVSGYRYNGEIINNVGSFNDTPRYNHSIFLDNSSTIKVSTNSWMPQGMEAMTINFWAKNTSWAGKHIFSCTESGGFNTEGGTSGYLRFPINVYTNAEKTSHAYKYDSKEIEISQLSTTDWNMLTFVYDNTGTRTYINGELHHTYNNTSYGIYFNTNARLFLGCEANSSSPSAPYFNGSLSDFRIYCTALSNEDIKELYQTSASIDDKQNFYGREFSDTLFDTTSITKAGIVSADDFIEDTLALIKDDKSIESNCFYEY